MAAAFMSKNEAPCSLLYVCDVTHKRLISKKPPACSLMPAKLFRRLDLERQLYVRIQGRQQESGTLHGPHQRFPGDEGAPGTCQGPAALMDIVRTGAAVLSVWNANW